ncbi:MAG: hypothetical protein AUG49_01465 [Catenulispora sp. 13_1_20CM_3_70_7]|jgi:hypothetical protein|nr:DUF2304 domain-containing protein [Catenulisporales bacterium]OLE28761.1 MAG: hypothetical protein AUG49_01465 [Catenulispora sp. 13_1_20CM_3_70_7]
MQLPIMTGVVALLLLALIFELLRRRQLREKYAVLWLVVGLVTLPLGFIPSSLDNVSSWLGVASGASLVLFLAVVFLLLICIHLSWEASRLEDETRALAEEVALIRAELRDVKEQQAGFRAQLEGEQAAANGHPVGIVAQRDGKAAVGER